MSSRESPVQFSEDALVAAAADLDGSLASHKRERLIDAPDVFTLAIVWESPQVQSEILTSAMASLQDEIFLEHVFCGLHQELPYQLKSMVAYSSSHYYAFVLSEEVNLWLLLDDAVISPVGKWSDVVRTVLAKKLQPSLLFYESFKNTTS